MSGQVKNQHYVPRMYLKRFAPEQKRFSVWHLQKDTILTRQHPENYAVSRYFYDTDIAGLRYALEEMVEIYPEIIPLIDLEDEQFVEKELSRIESDASIILDRICNNHKALYDKNNMKKLIIFLHELAYRSEKLRNQFDEMREVTLQHLGKMEIMTKNVKELERTGKDNQLYYLLGIAPLIETSMKLLESYDWYIGVVSGTMKLVVSDNPAQGIMLGVNDICIPLCGEKAIILRIKDREAPILSTDLPIGNEIRLSDRSVLKYNLIQLSYANRFMFGEKNSLISLKKLCDMYGGYACMYGEKSVLHK